jgi:hypothetical protein
MKAALIDESTNEVVNTIELEKNAKWEAPRGIRVVFVDEDNPDQVPEKAEIGKVYYEKKFRDA